MNISDSDHNKIILYNHRLIYIYIYIYIFVKVDFEDQFR